MYVMYDSVDLDQIPASAGAVAGYVGGAWPTYAEVVKRWPHAKHLSIAVNASEDAECLDIENGDATPAECPQWLARQLRRGVRRPVFYASQSVVGEIVAILKAQDCPRERYRIWSAHYTGQPHICGAHERLSWAADATQWTDKALGRNLDESLCTSAFFGAPSESKPKLAQATLTSTEARIVAEYERDQRHPRLRAHERQRLYARLVVLRKAIWKAAEEGRTPEGKATPRGWKIRDRKARYDLLWKLTR